MGSTTIKVSVATRDRIKVLGGETLEATIVEALDLLESQRFWAQAEAAAEYRRRLSPEERERHKRAEAELDAAFEGL